MIQTPRVHIVIGGKRHGHVPQGISHLNADAIHVITSTKFEEDYAEKMDDWSEEFEIRKGMLVAIPDEKLFSESAVEEIRKAMERIGESEGESFPMIQSTSKRWGRPVNCRFLVNITGGTNLMGGAAVHASAAISATCYYVIEDGEDGAGFPIVFPTLDLITMIGQHGRPALEEVLARPSGDLVELRRGGGSLVLDLCLRGMASIHKTGGADAGDDPGKYQISEESKRYIHQTIQNRAVKVSTDPERVLGRKNQDGARGDGPEETRMEPMVDGFSLSLGTIPSEMCSNQVVRAYLEKKDLEYRGEIWDWGEGEVLRTYFAKVGTREGGATWDNDDWRIGQFRQQWETPEEIDDKILKYPRNYEEDQRRAERISRIVSSENSLDKFALSFRLRGLNLGFRMDGSSDLPGGV